MSAHLTHEELTDKLLGGSSLTVNAHLLSCPECAHELEQMKNSIAGFRGAAHAWSENALAADRGVSVVPKLPQRSWTANWVLVAASLMLLAAALTFYLHDYQARNQTSSVQLAAPLTKIDAAQSQIESQIEKDNELLSQVDSELAEAVPAPMQPLGVLESSTSSTATTK
jgi:hypothetical protein